MANLGYHYIYRKLLELGVSVGRFFASPIPYRSVEGDVMLERFPVVLAGVAYEGDVPVFARWLLSGGISPSRKERESVGGPLIGAGGALTYINPLALTGICDFIVLGDGLPVLPHLVETLRGGEPREAALRRLAAHPSILASSLIAAGAEGLKISRRADISEDFGHGNWIAPLSAFGDTLLVELQRGCARKCGYCALPSCFGPLRRREPGMVLDDVRRAAAAADFGQVGLVTPEAGDYPGLEELLTGIGLAGKRVSFASLRVDGLTRNAIKALTGGGRHSITIAPESGDDVLRAACGKRFTNDEIVGSLSMAKEEGVTKVKLYFMIGLPGEGEKEILSIASLCGRIRKETGLRLTAAVSPFVPKPGTAWSGRDFAGEMDLRARFALLNGVARGIPGVELQCASIREASLEYAISWASSETSVKIVEAVKDAASMRKIAAIVDRDGTIAELERLGLFKK